MTAGVVDQESRRLAEGHQSGRPVQVHGRWYSVHHGGQLEGYPLRRLKPVQMAEQWGNMIIATAFMEAVQLK